MLLRCLFALAITPLIHVPAFGSSVAGDGPTRRINPLPLPDYPIGRLARDVRVGEPIEHLGLWLVDRYEQYRELADPSALWFEGRWYLYPSVDMAWTSDDEGRTWQHHPLNVRDIGYAPTIVHHRGRFLLMASGSEVYAAATPLGPFESIGRLEMPEIAGLPGQIDPMLFSDDDGRLFYYWGCTPDSGIWGVELDPEVPTKLVGEPRELIPFLPDTYKWERVGSHNQNPTTGWMEGAWMIKHDGRYYLTYSAGGTQYRTYTMGAYVSDSPLGPFRSQKRSPIFRTTEGLVTGTAHGSIVRGPRDRHWVFYTVYACAAHGFERRVGMDLVEFDENGEIHVPRATVTPQALPGEDGAEWEVLNESEANIGSSSAPNAPGRFAADNSMTTWWLPAAYDKQPTLTAHFNGRARITAARVIWHDVGLDTTGGAVAGPFRYRIEAETTPGEWTTIIDRTTNETDLLIDYRECAPTPGVSRARLVITGSPVGISPAVAEFTLFGMPER